MTALYVIGGVVCFFAVFLLSRVHLRFVYEEKPKLKLRFWFITLDLKKLLDRPKKEKKKKAEKKKKPAPVQENAPEEKKKRSFSETLDSIRFITRLLKKLLKDLFSRLRIRVSALRMSVGASEPHVTALLYGAAQPAVFQLCELASHFLDCRIDYKKVGVYPYFPGAYFDAECDADVSLRIIDALILGLKALKVLITVKTKKGENKDERNTVEAGD
ncbi:MAG: hypothetical protein IJV00_07055 [Clostridia bacterium]|nr:hypothetical protein [Clostridia bacterium]